MSLGVRTRASLAIGITLVAADCLPKRVRLVSGGASRDARRRPLVRDQDVRSATSVRADRVHRRSRDLRHVAHLQGRRRLASASDGSAELPSVERCEDVHLPAQARHPVRRRDSHDGRRRRLLVPPIDQPQGQPFVPARGRRVSATGKYTVVLRSATPNTALPAIVANTSLGIVNSKLAKRNGATAVGADKTDKAEKWFNSAASRGAGSGPSCSGSTARRHRSSSSRTRATGSKPAFERVVIRNMIAATQFVNVQRGTHEVAIDLSAQHAQSLRNSQRVGVTTQPSTWVFWLFANNNPSISQRPRTSGSSPPFATPSTIARSWNSPVPSDPGAIIPSMFLGALPPTAAVSRNLNRARSELAASGVGDQTFTVEYPSDLTINGVASPPASGSRRTSRTSG